jgi:hypothetical protein
VLWDYFHDPILLLLGKHKNHSIAHAIGFLFSHHFSKSIAFEIGLENKKPINIVDGFSFAENEGFEPPVPCGTIVFKTTAFDHSANSPGQK